MEKTNLAFDWQTALITTYQDFAQQVVGHIPQLLGALLLLLTGWIVASVLRVLTRKLMRGVDVLMLKAAQRRGDTTAAQHSYAKLSGNIVFWSVLIFFIAASGSMLEWQLFSSLTTTIVTYLPNIITGLLIIMAGFAISGVTRTAVLSTCETAGLSRSEEISRLAQITIVLTAIVIGVEQLGINVAFLSTTLIVAAGVMLGGAALAFGLGARDFVANIIGAQNAGKHYQVGQRLKIETVEGFLLEITPTTLIIDTEKGRATVPAKLMLQQISEIVETGLDPDAVNADSKASADDTGKQDA